MTTAEPSHDQVRIVVPAGLPADSRILEVKIGRATMTLEYATMFPAGLANHLLDAVAHRFEAPRRVPAPDGGRLSSREGETLTVALSFAEPVPSRRPLPGSWLTGPSRPHLAPPRDESFATRNWWRRLVSPLHRHERAVPAGWLEFGADLPPLQLTSWTTYFDPRVSSEARLRVAARTATIPDLRGEIRLGSQYSIRAWSPDPAGAALPSVDFLERCEELCRRWPETTFELSRRGFSASSHDILADAAALETWLAEIRKTAGAARAG